MTKRRQRSKKPTGVNQSLGQSLSNDRNRARVAHRIKSCELENPAFIENLNNRNDAKNAQSVTNETSLEEFMAKVELAGIEFNAERGDLKIFSCDDTRKNTVLEREVISCKELKQRYADRLRIPRRPSKELWETADELRKVENEIFLEWRRNLAELQQLNLVLTPFERNLELWRQLWRVIERSDIIVQIVDARNPLLFRSIDLERYVCESGPGKQNLLLINKADMLNEEQLLAWKSYFQRENVDAVFWTALEAENETKEEEDKNDEQTKRHENEKMTPTDHLFVSPEQLITLLKQKGGCSNSLNRPLIVGTVGYPNVGKSSTINRLLGRKKVPVSSTPGRTRHLQTLSIDSQLTLCDCPGLVMPSFAVTRSEMLLNGILSVDHMNDFMGPISLLASRIPRPHLEHVYGIKLPQPGEHELSTQPPTAGQLTTAVAFVRGFMSSKGIPDGSRAARLIIKDVLVGKLKWIAAPPTINQDDFDVGTYLTTTCESTKGCVALLQMEKRHLLTSDHANEQNCDRLFFGQNFVRLRRFERTMGIKGTNVNSQSMTDSSLSGKPWKKHENRNKKEKLRRVYSQFNP